MRRHIVAARRRCEDEKPVAGIAMGLITDYDSPKYAILSDILGDEDHLGDMDFKVTGTTDGITATQMDIKCDGLSYEILEKALNQAREGRLHILGIINETIPAPREDYKPHVPRIETLVIPKEFIGAVIGPGGKSSKASRNSRVQSSLSRKKATMATSRLPHQTRTQSTKLWLLSRAS